MGKQCSQKNIHIEDLLLDIGESKTKTKISLLGFIQNADKPVSSQEICDFLTEVNESTIFRNLKKFVLLGIISEVDLGEGFRRFEMVPKNHHHHHIICDECGLIDAIHSCDIAVLEKQLKKIGYKNIKHKIEFSGLCISCQ